MIVDAGGANIASLRFALERLGQPSRLTRDERLIRKARRVILPGVGAARDAMDRLESAGLAGLIRELEQPLLGICLGLQLLHERSDEDDAECLAILPGVARRLEPGPGRPVPHMGWNRVRHDGRSPLLAGIADGAHFYFVHSYAVDPGPATVGRTQYGREFASVVGRGNVYATQFHPERSGAAGARLLANFLEL